MVTDSVAVIHRRDDDGDFPYVLEVGPVDEEPTHSWVVWNLGFKLPEDSIDKFLKGFGHSGDSVLEQQKANSSPKHAARPSADAAFFLTLRTLSVAGALT